jgi:uncharacterized protein YjbI with pentapeptide repeats
MNLTKQEALAKIEELKLYIAEDNKETKKVVIEIKNRFTGSVKFTSEKTTIKEAVVENKANLSEANLYGANLSGADLSGANLSEANFYDKVGTTKINKSQINDFLTALGIVVIN